MSILKEFQHLQIPLQDLQSATDDFSDTNCIGRGGFGKVYKGEILLNGVLTMVAIKRLDSSPSGQGTIEFWKEIMMHSQYKHENLVSLLGFCDEGGERLLVYEYLSLKSLDLYLSSTDFSWHNRLFVCLGAAKGLKFLHEPSEESQHRVLHRDVKSANILFGEDWVAKVSSDFGLSKMGPANEQFTFLLSSAVGTHGYTDPLYARTGMLTKESDVYSFGLVLFEVLCGRPVIEHTYNDSRRFLGSLAQKCYEQKNLDTIIYNGIRDTISTKSLERFSAIAYQCLHIDRAERPSMAKIVAELEIALNHQINRDFGHLRIPLEEILHGTGNFAVENIIGEDGSGKIYKGQLLRSKEPINIVARKLDGIYGQEVPFWMEISMLSSLKHKNIVTIFGFCVENDEKIIIYENAVHGSLDKHLNDANLTWFQRLQICLGAARALSFIHYDVIHCDINSSKVFLDKDWEAKVFGFELSTKYPESWRHRLLFSQHLDTKDYIDEVHMRTGTVTPKYDVYSFGVILFEVLGVRKVTNGDGVVNQSVAANGRHLYQEKKLDELIDPKLREQMDAHSLTLFSEIAYSCLNKECDQRPTMDQVVRELEDALELQWKRINTEHPAAVDEGTSSNSLKTESLECLTIQFSDIKSATDSFNNSHCIGSGGYGMVYKADLNLQTLSSLKGKDKDELPKRRSTVAIKRILNRQDEQHKQGFWAEIELLTRCKHVNIVSLLGFSSKDREMILVYEFLINGSLDDYLGSTKRKINFTWNQRVRICLDIAEGLRYLHTDIEGKPKIIHRDIKSANILLDENWNAKIADFGLSKFHPANQLASTIQSQTVAGTEVYLDPEYLRTGNYKKESDIYSFGVVLFEILSGTLAYNPLYLKENNFGLAPIARRSFNEQTIKELIDPRMTEEDNEYRFSLNRGPNQDSFDTFSKIAYRCLAETQAKRPTMEVIIKELQKALILQGETGELSKFQFSNIVKATNNFAETYCIDLDTYGKVYKAELDQFESESSSSIEERINGEQPRKFITVAIKRISSRTDGPGEQGFFEEIEMRSSYKHPNIVSLLGFCDKGSELIIVYEHASNGSLDDYLRTDKMAKLSWKQRLHKCIEIARGLNHLHTKMSIQQTLIHGDIRSANILLGKNLETKISYFGLSKLHLVKQYASTPSTNDSLATKVYRDPESEKTDELGIKSDVYSFGVVIFEIFCGRLAYDPVYIAENDKGLAHIARRCFNDGTIKKLIDPRLLEEMDENTFTSNKGINQNSLDTFIKIVHQCLGETQAERPTLETVINELEKALDFQENLMSSLQFSLEEIKVATQNFSKESFIRSGRDWQAYKGETPHPQASGGNTVIAKRWNSNSGQGDHQFRKELDILFKCKHENIIGLVGYCKEMNETIIVYKHASNRSLNEHLNNASLTWTKRLKICIDVASGLEFLHGGAVILKKVVHRDIKSASILLTSDWRAKISNFELSVLDSVNHDLEHAGDNAYGTFGYLDPEYVESGFLTEESDIYSFGVILFETLCGRLAWTEGCVDQSQSLGPLAKGKYEDGTLDEIVFEGIKENIIPQSLATFEEIAYQCILDVGNERPEASEILVQLKKALEYQEDGEIWEPKLPRNYKEVIAMTETPAIYHDNTKKNLFKLLFKGIFIQNEKVWFSLSNTGKGNAFISATMFSYENHRSHKWRSIQTPTTRFHKVAKMTDLSNLKIRIKINTTFLSPDVNYRVHLIFKFCNPRKSSKNRMYVNMKYNMGFESLHSYFTTKKGEDEGWMMIELLRFLNKKEDTTFEISLESFSRCYCESGAIYVQGLEFTAIDNMKYEETKNLEDVKEDPKSNMNMDQTQQLPIGFGDTSNKSENIKYGELLLIRKVNGVIHLMLSAKLVLYSPSKMKPVHFQPSTESRFEDVAELQRQQTLRIKYKIEIEKLSPFTKYSCYLVFKLSEKCRGLHCPIKVQDLPRQKNQETRILYFRSPAPWNQHDGNWVPKQRKDGWMEVMVWNFNSKQKPGENYIAMNLKLVTYEGTLSGLTICGLEIRPR